MLGRILRIDLSRRRIHTEEVDTEVILRFIGGAGLGAYLLYREVPPETAWRDPENRLIIAAGPLNATQVAGAGSFCVVTKGPLTNGATSSQANGFFGAYLRLSGFQAIVVSGASEDWVYLYVHDGTAELRSASGLVGKDTLETESIVKHELHEETVSVYSIGPAGENLVRFACILGDEGHAVAHNGAGAVMGSKKLKAFVAGRGNVEVEVKDKEALKNLNQLSLKRAKQMRPALFDQGTSNLLGSYVSLGLLPVKNLTTNIFEDYERLTGEYYRSRFELRRRPCWKCPLKHVHTVKVTEGPYTGYVGDEPDYELFAGWGPLIGQTDPGAVVMLSDTVDRLGMDSNEASWLMALVIECYEKGVLSRGDTAGIEMTWGNAESVRNMLKKVASREGIGDTLAEGVMRAAQTIGGKALDMAVYVHKGNAPRNHDHRVRWHEIVDTATSDCGTIQVGPQVVEDPCSAEAIVRTMTTRRIRSFVDSMVVCAFPFNLTTGDRVDDLVSMLNAVTGWEFTEEEAKRTTMRIDTLMRAFNVRHGVDPNTEKPSPRYGSAQVDGPVKAKSVMPYWEEILDLFYNKMGWDRKSGKPLPETLHRLDLDFVVADLWRQA